MTTFYTLLISGTLSLSYQRCYSATATNPFTTPTTISISSSYVEQPAKIISFNGIVISNKVMLQWSVTENETADQFEVEKSIDGKTFVMMALVFGTDKPETDQYQFYEKVNKKKVSYRIKLINKDQQTAYSAVIEIGPETSINK